MQSQKGEWSQYREKWKEIGITVHTKISQGREKLKDIWYYIFHIQVKLCLSVIAQITLGPDLCTVQTGPNLPGLLAGFIWWANTRWRRGTTVLEFCLYFILTSFPRNLNETCCPGQLSALKMCIHSPEQDFGTLTLVPWDRTFDSNIPVRYCCWIVFTHYAAPPLHQLSFSCAHVGNETRELIQLWNPLWADYLYKASAPGCCCAVTLGNVTGLIVLDLFRSCHLA